MSKLYKAFFPRRFAPDISRVPSVFIATPAMTLHGNFVVSTALLAHKLTDFFNVHLVLLTGNCHVDDARNVLLREFLDTDAERLVFIDADVGFRADELVQLCRCGTQGVLAGSYPKKDPTQETFPVMPIPGQELFANTEGLVEVLGAATGCMVIDRGVVEELAEKAEKFKPAASEGVVPLVFERALINGARTTGDYVFCHKAREIGASIYVAPEMTLSHEGDYEWVGSLGRHWRKRHGLADEEMIAHLDVLRRGHESPSTYIRLTELWDNGAWTASAEFLVAMVEAVRATSKYACVLECGSGLTTLVLAAVAEKRYAVSLEHDTYHYAHVLAELKKAGFIRHGLQYASLAKDGWYSYVPAPSVDLLIVDGPPRHLGRREAVFGFEQVANAIVLADDCGDPAVLQPFTKWAEQQGRSPTILKGQKGKLFAISIPNRQTEEV